MNVDPRCKVLQDKGQGGHVTCCRCTPRKAWRTSQVQRNALRARLVTEGSEAALEMIDVLDDLDDFVTEVLSHVSPVRHTLAIQDQIDRVAIEQGFARPQPGFEFEIVDAADPSLKDYR